MSSSGPLVIPDFRFVLVSDLLRKDLVGDSDGDIVLVVLSPAKACAGCGNDQSYSGVSGRDGRAWCGACGAEWPLVERLPGFKAQTGRDPIPGKDYDPNGEFCQDSHEYYTGTGAYY